MSAICDFGQPFHIAYIFWSRMADQNCKMADIFVGHFWVSKVMNSTTLYIYMVKINNKTQQNTNSKWLFYSNSTLIHWKPLY
jgi:hypothetical protein